MSKDKNDIDNVPPAEATVKVAEPKKLGKRTPIYKQVSQGIKTRPGFVRYQVAEKPGRVEMFLEAGWRPCTGDDLDLRDSRVQHDSQLGSVMRSVVNRKPDAAFQTALWMEIEEEYYLEDKKHKERMNSEKQAAWNPKNVQKANPDLYYTSDLEIK